MAKIGKENDQKIKKFDSKEMFKIFLENNFDGLLEFINKYGINAVDRDGRNILLNCITENKIEWAKYIINNFSDLDINSKDNTGWSALHFAVNGLSYEIIDELLKHKTIKINITDEYGRTVLMNLRHKNKASNSDDVIIKLLEAGVDINKSDNYGKKPYDYLFVKVNNYLKEKNIK